MTDDPRAELPRTVAPPDAPPTSCLVFIETWAPSEPSDRQRFLDHFEHALTDVTTRETASLRASGDELATRLEEGMELVKGIALVLEHGLALAGRHTDPELIVWADDVRALLGTPPEPA